MEAIKLATDEQIARIRDEADLGGNCNCYALGDDVAVIRLATEIDPVFWGPDVTLRRKRQFIWGLETFLRLSGVPAYYFQAEAADAEWRSTVETMGAKARNGLPEIRYKVTL